ncbi:MAG: hypothetical protein HZC24_17265 [Rhodocyclales bacterium]|nr:hypothetical protein [Rhodocyclales bacterium]
MKSILLLTHIAAVGIWTGCVVTEALFERALLGKGKPQELILVTLHKRVDLCVEIPAFTIVLVTGAFMVAGADIAQPFLVKIGFGISAIVANIYCVWLVFRRAAAAHADRWDEFARLDHLQHKFGAVVLLAIIVALTLAAYLHGRV